MRFRAGQVYANDKHCKEVKLSPQERLLYHQAHSQPLMDALRLWLNNQLTYELNEPNSGLGEAVRYMLRHWIPLTTFLRVAGPPLARIFHEGCNNLIFLK
jgi:transposase